MALPLAQYSEERKAYIRVPIFHSACCRFGLSHSTISMTAHIFAGHSFCPHEWKPKAHTFCVPEQLLVWEMKKLLDLLPGGASGRRQWLPREQVASGDNEGISGRIKAVRWRRRYWWTIVEKSLGSSSLSRPSSGGCTHKGDSVSRAGRSGKFSVVLRGKCEKRL